MRLFTGRESARSGSAVLSVVVVLSSVALVLAISVSSSLQRAHLARKLSNRVRAHAIAEAGVSDAYAALYTNWGAITNSVAFPVKPFGGGTFDVTVTSTDPYWAVICSTGWYGGTEQSVILDVKLAVETQSGPSSPAFDCTILAERDITWSGGGDFRSSGVIRGNAALTQSGSGELNCDVKATGAVRLNGNSGYIDGDVWSPEISGKTSKIMGAMHVEPVAAIPIPVLDLTPYYNHADSQVPRQVFTGKKTINSDLVVPGGIMWVNGDLDISGDIDLTGCFIATGDIKIAGNGRHFKVNGYPAFVSRDGSIQFPGGKEIEGLLYTRIGDVDMSGGGHIRGAIICGGEFKKTGGSTVFSYVKSVPEVPGQVQAQGRVLAMAWQK